MKITLSKNQWEFIGDKAGWMKKAELDTLSPVQELHKYKVEYAKGFDATKSEIVEAKTRDEAEGLIRAKYKLSMSDEIKATRIDLPREKSPLDRFNEIRKALKGQPEGSNPDLEAELMELYVRIKRDYGFNAFNGKDINPSRLSENDKNTQIKLSKNQWEFLGKKAGWHDPDGNPYIKEDGTPMTPEDGEKDAEEVIKSIDEYFSNYYKSKKKNKKKSN